MSPVLWGADRLPAEYWDFSSVMSQKLSLAEGVLDRIGICELKSRHCNV